MIPACLPPGLAARIGESAEESRQIQPVPSLREESPTARGGLRNEEKGTPETEPKGTPKLYSPRCSAPLRESRPRTVK